MNLKYTTILSLFVLIGLGSNAIAQAAFDTLTVYDLQYVANPATNDTSFYYGDTVVVKAMVMTGPRDLWIGNRWSAYVVDLDSFPKPWSGFFIVQNDTSEINTLFQFTEPGTIAYFTGQVTTFGNFNQLNLLDGDFVVPVDILSTDNTIPEPVLLTAADLVTPASAEQWESMLVRIENATVVNNNISGNWASYMDGTGTGYLAEYSLWFYNALGNNTYTWPAPGTNINVTGFTRDESGSPGRVYSVNPMVESDVEILSNPPVFSNITRTPGAPASSNSVVIWADIVDNTTVQSATLHYSINNGPFTQKAMTLFSAPSYSATIPAAADGDFIRYFFTAVDGDGDDTQVPGDTSASVYFYVVRDGAMSVRDVQYTHGYPVDASGYRGYVVTLRGIVMVDSLSSVGDHFIQDSDQPWSGIWLNAIPDNFNIGDSIEVTGTVEENFGVTRLNIITSATLIQAGVGAYDPVPLEMADFTSTLGEAYESMLIRFSNAEVTVEFPDGVNPTGTSPNYGFGEFTINDGTGNMRVDDFFMDNFPGQSNHGSNLYDTTYYVGDKFETITGIGYYSFSNYKLAPRNLDDLVLVTSIIKNNFQPKAFSLEQNYPNPFNPTTTIKYFIAEASQVKLTIYDSIGRRISSLVNTKQTPGEYTITFDASRLSTGVYFYRLEAGNFIQTHKMLLIK